MIDRRGFHLPERAPERAEPLLRLIAAVLLGAALLGLIGEVRGLRAELEQRPPVAPVHGCSQVVKLPDAEVPGWYCVPSGEEG